MSTKAVVGKRVRAVYETRAEAVAAGKAVQRCMTAPAAWRLEVVQNCGMQDEWLWALVCGGLRFKLSGGKWCCHGYNHYVEMASTANPSQVVLKTMLKCRLSLVVEVQEFRRLAEKVGYRLPGMEPLAMADTLSVEAKGG